MEGFFGFYSELLENQEIIFELCTSVLLSPPLKLLKTYWSGRIMLPRWQHFENFFCFHSSGSWKAFCAWRTCAWGSQQLSTWDVHVASEHSCWQAPREEEVVFLTSLVLVPSQGWDNNAIRCFRNTQQDREVCVLDSRIVTFMCCPMK